MTRLPFPLRPFVFFIHHVSYKTTHILYFFHQEITRWSAPNPASHVLRYSVSYVSKYTGRFILCYYYIIFVYVFILICSYLNSFKLMLPVFSFLVMAIITDLYNINLETHKIPMLHFITNVL